jgi:hypothetical protein
VDFTPTKGDEEVVDQKGASTLLSSKHNKMAIPNVSRVAVTAETVHE